MNPVFVNKDFKEPLNAPDCTESPGVNVGWSKSCSGWDSRLMLAKPRTMFNIVNNVKGRQVNVQKSACFVVDGGPVGIVELCGREPGFDISLWSL